MVFITKFKQDIDYNGKKCEVLRTENIKGVDYCTIKFEDGHIIRQVYKHEIVEEGVKQ